MDAVNTVDERLGIQPNTEITGESVKAAAHAGMVTQRIQITLPAGVTPGMTIQLQIDATHAVEIQVPEGHKAGDTLAIDVPLPTGAAAAAQQANAGVDEVFAKPSEFFKLKDNVGGKYGERWFGICARRTLLPGMKAPTAQALFLAGVLPKEKPAGVETLAVSVVDEQGFFGRVGEYPSSLEPVELRMDVVEHMFGADGVELLKAAAAPAIGATLFMYLLGTIHPLARPDCIANLFFADKAARAAQKAARAEEEAAIKAEAAANAGEAAMAE